MQPSLYTAFVTSGNFDLDLIFTAWWARYHDIVMDYPCAKFGDCIFSRFGFIVRQTDRQTDRQNHRHTDADDRLTHATIVRVSNNNNSDILFSLCEIIFIITNDLTPSSSVVYLRETPRRRQSVRTVWLRVQ